MTEATPKLRVFLCHSSNDKLIVRDLYRRLDAEGWIDAWLDEVKLYPGQDWNFEIEKAVEAADVILVCLTNNSVNKEGYIQRELRIVLDLADYKPEGTLFIIPVRLEECEPPRRLRTWHYADYFPEEERNRSYKRLLDSLRMRAKRLGISPLSRTGERTSFNETEKVVPNVSEEKIKKEMEDHERGSSEKRESIQPITYNPENAAQKMKLAWWQLTLLVILISAWYIIILPSIYQKILMLVTAVSSVITLTYILPQKSRTISTDFSGIKFKYTFPAYLSVGDEATIRISVHNLRQTEFNGNVTLIFNDPDSGVTPAPDTSLSVKVSVQPRSKQSRLFKFLLLKRPSDGNLNYYFAISFEESRYVSNGSYFQIAPIPYLRSAWPCLFSAGLGALILALLWNLLEKWISLR